MDFRRLKQVCLYGWRDADTISKLDGVRKSRLSVFVDILRCFFRYNVWSNQYKQELLYALRGEEREQICKKYQDKNNKRDLWVKEFFDNYKFLNKWSSFKYERSAELQAKRREAYRKKYNLGENCFIGYGVILHKHHYKDARIDMGINCLIAEETNIDYTGGLIVGNNVSISEGVKILTHNHSIGTDETGLEKGCILTPLKIHDGVWIGTRAIIMPGVKEIGRGAIVSAGSYVNMKVPPYAIVLGNPAKVVGFKKTPEEIMEYERIHYNENDRIPASVVYGNYEKYFSSRWREIKNWCKL